MLYRIIWNDHEEIHNLELWAGFIGMEMDWENRTLKTSVSWMMREKSEREDEHCHRFTVISLEEITVPSDLSEWCRKNHIEKLTVKAPMTDEQKADILSQFPDAEVVQL